MYCWSDLNGRLQRHRRASPSTVKNIRIENAENTKKNKQRHENKKIRYKKRQNTTMIRRNIMRKTQRYREGNKEAMRQTQRERYKRDKDKINAKSRERRKQKNKLQLLINQ